MCTTKPLSSHALPKSPHNCQAPGTCGYSINLENCVYIQLLLRQADLDALGFELCGDYNH